jgi:hypothetical protein
MSHTYFSKPGLGPLRPVVEAAARAFGYETEPFGSGGAWLVTGHRHQDSGAAR